MGAVAQCVLSCCVIPASCIIGTAQVPRYSAIPLEGGVDLLVPDFGLARSGCCGHLGIEPVFRKLLSISSPPSLSLPLSLTPPNTLPFK